MADLSDLLLGRVDHILNPPPAPPSSAPPRTGLAGLLQGILGSALTGNYLSNRGNVRADTTEGLRGLHDFAFDVLSNPSPGNLGITRIPNPIRAFHGSPHQFDEFRLDRVGSGEGAQAYGHGLYFAESEPVARTYRGGQFSLTDPVTQARSYLDAAGGDRQGALTRLLADQQRLSRDTAYVQQLEEAANLLRSGRGISPGHMYEVNLHARPEQFLDWDRPLSGQSGEVTRALRPLLGELPDWQGRDALGSILSGARFRAGDYSSRTAGDDFVAQTLGQAGIPGIRYLDAGSRTGGAGTRNYVVWSPEIIEIMRRYGLIGPVAGLGAAGLADRQQ